MTPKMALQQSLCVLAISSFRFLPGTRNQNDYEENNNNTKNQKNGYLQCLLGVINFGVLFADSFLSDQNNKTKNKNERENGLGIERINVDVGSCTAISVKNKEHILINWTFK